MTTQDTMTDGNVHPKAVKRILDEISEINTRLTKLEQSVASSNIDKQLLVTKTNNVISPGQYTKVEINKDGLVMSAGKLEANDIPVIQINNIDGLFNKLSLLENELNKLKSVNDKKLSDILPKVFDSEVVSSNVRVNEFGIVTAADPINIYDSQSDMEKCINELKNELGDLKIHVDNSLNAISSSDDNSTQSVIAPGTYTKFKVNSNGVIVNAGKMSVRELDGYDEFMKDIFDKIDMNTSKIVVERIEPSPNIIEIPETDLNEVYQRIDNAYADILLKLESKLDNASFTKVYNNIQNIATKRDANSNVDINTPVNNLKIEMENMINNKFNELRKRIDSLNLDN